MSVLRRPISLRADRTIRGAEIFLLR